MHELSIDLHQVVLPDLSSYGSMMFFGETGSWLSTGVIYLQRNFLLEKLDGLPKNNLSASTRPRHYSQIYIRNI